MRCSVHAKPSGGIWQLAGCCSQFSAFGPAISPVHVVQSARAEPFNQVGARKPWRPDQLAPQCGMRLCCGHMDQILGGSTVPAVAFCTLPERFFRSAPRAVDGTQERHANGKRGGRFACRHDLLYISCALPAAVSMRPPSSVNLNGRNAER